MIKKFTLFFVFSISMTYATENAEPPYYGAPSKIQSWMKSVEAPSTESRDSDENSTHFDLLYFTPHAQPDNRQYPSSSAILKEDNPSHTVRVTETKDSPLPASTAPKPQDEDTEKLATVSSHWEKFSSMYDITCKILAPKNWWPKLLKIVLINGTT
jgi:hypothetical protein